jgi:hypothetical protein
MKFKITLRNKFTAEITTDIEEADSERELREYYTSQFPVQILACREVGQKVEKPSKPVYTRTQTLRNRVERDLSDKQMKLGKYSPEAVVAAKVKEELKRVQENLENAKDLTDALNQE